MTRVSALLIATVVSGSALAADKGATFSLNLPVLSYSSTETKQKPDGGTEAKETRTALESADLDQAWVSVGFGPAVVYLWSPFTDAKKFRGGYVINDMLEAGLTLGLNNFKEKESKAEETDNRIGLYVQATPKVGPAHLEVLLGFDSVSKKGKTVSTAGTPPTTTTADVEESGTELEFSTTALVPLASNLNYGAGFWYTMSSNDIKKPGKQKDSASQFGLTLASLRLTLN
jgi:hypothetical protein